jgi:transposase
VDARGCLVCLKVTPGQAGDGPIGRELLRTFEPGQIGHVIADTAYDGDETRAEIKRLRSKACIKPHPNRTTKKRYDRARYKHRNQVERFFARIKIFRRVANRYEKLISTFAGFVWLAALLKDVL